MSKVDYRNVALAGLPQYELDRVQSVVNAAAELTADARRYDHVTQLLMDLHWLRVPQRIQYKLCVLVGVRLPERNSTEILVRHERVCRQCRMLSAPFSVNLDLVVPQTRRASIGDRAFAVAGPRAWNSLPPALRSTSRSFSAFEK